MTGSTAVLLLLLFCHAATASEILPSRFGYEFAPIGNHTGTWTYDDPAFQKLSDGIYGTDDWTVHQGAEWVGWRGIDVGADSAVNVYDIELIFEFDPGVTISSVVLGTNQDALYTWNVLFPSEITVDNGIESRTIETPYDPSNSGEDLGDGINRGKRHEVVFNYNPFTATTLTITLNNSANFNNSLYGDTPANWNNSLNDPWNGRYWVFLDEVDFYDTTYPVPEPYSAVPEPSSLFLLASGLAVALGLRIRMKKSVR
jgi:hypothetical protein